MQWLLCRDIHVRASGHGVSCIFFILPGKEFSLTHEPRTEVCKLAGVGIILYFGQMGVGRRRKKREKKMKIVYIVGGHKYDSLKTLTCGGCSYYFILMGNVT